MKNTNSFTVKNSDTDSEIYYIDCAGNCRISEIEKLTGLEWFGLEQIYLSCGAKLNADDDVYYFTSRNDAAGAAFELEDYLQKNASGKMVFLTFEEMKYICYALINEGSNIINVKNDLKRGIIDKFT